MRHWNVGLLALAAGSALVLAPGTPGRAQAVKGKPAPEFSGTAIGGEKITLAGYRGKNPVIVSFYGEVCPTAPKFFAHLRELDERHGAKGLRFVAVSIDQDKATAAKIPNDARVKFPVIVDLKEAIATKYQVQALPHTVVVEKDGTVSRVVVGSDLDALDRAIEDVMK